MRAAAEQWTKWLCAWNTHSGPPRRGRERCPFPLLKIPTRSVVFRERLNRPGPEPGSGLLIATPGTGMPEPLRGNGRVWRCTAAAAGSGAANCQIDKSGH